MRIQIVTVGTPQAKVAKTGKSYTAVQIDYVENGQAGKTLLNSYSKAYKPLAAAVPGDLFDIGTEQNGQYTNWNTAEHAGKAEATAVAQAATAVKSTYETAEERAMKQIYITRSASLKTAVEYFKLFPEDPALAPQDVIQVAQVFEEYIFNGVADTTPPATTTEPTSARVE